MKPNILTNWKTKKLKTNEEGQNNNAKKSKVKRTLNK